jgi:hypothetical protein
MKIPSHGITQYFADEVNWVLDLLIGVELPSFDDDCHIDHVACSQYVKLQVFMGFRGHQGAAQSESGLRSPWQRWLAGQWHQARALV